jgi:hypothetical protein
MITIQNAPGMRGCGDRRMVEEVNSCMIYLIYCENFYKCHNVPPSSQLADG